MENNNIQTAWEHIKTAQSVRDGSTRKVREIMDAMREYKSTINGNRELSDDGKRNYVDKLRAEYEVKTMQLSQVMHDEHDNATAEAVRIAEAVLAQPLPKVDETERTLYLQKAEALLAKAQFSTNSKAAIEALRTLTEMTSYPSLAAEIKPQVFSMAQQIMTTSPNPSELHVIKKELGDLYAALSEKAMPEGAKEAREIINVAKAMSQTPIMSDFVRQSLAEISPLARHYANNPNDYFNRNKKGE